MTISESVIEWLHGYEGGFELIGEIKTDQLSEDAESFGVFNTPRDSEVVFVDGSRDVTVHYLFLARQPSQTDDMRQSNQAWLEGLERWIRQQNRLRVLPEMDQGRTCFSVSVTGSYAAEEQNSAETVYQLGVAISYFSPCDEHDK